MIPVSKAENPVAACRMHTDLGAAQKPDPVFILFPHSLQFFIIHIKIEHKPKPFPLRIIDEWRILIIMFGKTERLNTFLYCGENHLFHRRLTVRRKRCMNVTIGYNRHTPPPVCLLHCKTKTRRRKYFAESILNFRVLVVTL